VLANFDYGFWDEASNAFWHANHMQYKDAARSAADPMKVLQSTREKFVKGYIDFDRIVFGVALAQNYQPGGSPRSPTQAHIEASRVPSRPRRAGHRPWHVHLWRFPPQ
jgi:hypothetical protein